MTKKNQNRKPSKTGRDWIDKHLEKEGTEGDSGARARWTEAWFAKQARYYATKKATIANKKAGADPPAA